MPAHQTMRPCSGFFRLPAMHRRAFLSVLLLLGGCGLFDTEEGSFYNSQALGSGVLLYASYGESGSESDLSLVTVNYSSGSAITGLLSASEDYAGPTVGKNSSGQWLLAYGMSTLKVMNSVSLKKTRVEGPGSSKRAIALDPLDTGAISYMAGSPSEGFNVVVQSSATGTPIEITTDATSTKSYWTPAWSPDGQTILFTEVNDSGWQLWTVNADGTGATQLSFAITEVPTYAIFSADGDEIFVPGDFTSFRLSSGLEGSFDHIRDIAFVMQQLDDMGYEPVGSPLTGPVHTGDAVTQFRHTFPISGFWHSQGDRLFFDALVATNFGDPPHEVLGVGIFSYLPGPRILAKIVDPMPLTEAQSENYTYSVFHPVIVP
jgi:hypothetical protein